MDGAAGEASDAALRVPFDPRLKLEFHGSKVTSDAGLLPFRDLDDALGLTDLAGEALADTRTGQNDSVMADPHSDRRPRRRILPCSRRGHGTSSCERPGITAGTL